MLLRYQVAMATNDTDVIAMLYCQTFMCNKSLVQNTITILYPLSFANHSWRSIRKKKNKQGVQNAMIQNNAYLKAKINH